MADSPPNHHELSSVDKKTRRPAHTVPRDYIAKYKLGTKLMKELPADDPRGFDAQADILRAYGGEDWLFFPFHRWYLYFYERILGKLIADAGFDEDRQFALPYWNWDDPRGMTVPKMFISDEQSLLYDKNRNPEKLKPVDLGFHTSTSEAYSTDMVENNLYLVYNEMIRSSADAFDFMGSPSTGAGTIERGPHASVLRWLGGDVSQNYLAVRDPLFYAHLVNIDRMWWLWQENNKALKRPSLRDDPRFVPEFLDASFEFYDENKRLVRVTVADCLDNSQMGYEYKATIYPWKDYKILPCKIIKARESARRDDALIPLNLDKPIKLVVDKAAKGKQKELLVFEGIVADPGKSLNFQVFVSRKDEGEGLYAGTWGQLQHNAADQHKTTTPPRTSFRLELTHLYEYLHIKDDDEAISVVLVPWEGETGITIDTIKIIPNTNPHTHKEWLI